MSVQTYRRSYIRAMAVELKTERASRAHQPLRCPSCGLDSGAPTARCAHCRLTLRSLDPKFGAVPRHSRYLTDRSEVLPLRELERLRDRLRLFHQKFPQSLFSVFVTELPAGVSVSEYAFWLVNRARFSSNEGKLEENYNLVLLIDLANGAAALTAGYGLEPFVTEQELQDVLAAGSDLLRERQTGEAIRNCIDAMTECLRANVKRVERSCEA